MARDLIRPITIPTERGGVKLRELATPADDEAYFAAVEASPEHLARFCSEVLEAYKSVDDVRATREANDRNKKLRLGIWDADQFTGTVNLTHLDERVGKIGYWLDARHTGKGYATLAVNALTAHAMKSHDYLLADVDVENVGSAAVLLRVGFVVTDTVEGMNLFEYPPPTASVPSANGV